MRTTAVPASTRRGGTRARAVRRCGPHAMEASFIVRRLYGRGHHIICTKGGTGAAQDAATPWAGVTMNTGRVYRCSGSHERRQASADESRAVLAIRLEVVVNRSVVAYMAWGRGEARDEHEEDD